MTRVLMTPGVVLVAAVLAVAGCSAIERADWLLEVRGLDPRPVVQLALVVGVVLVAAVQVLIVHQEDHPR